MPERTADAVREGGLRTDQGTVELGSETWERNYSFELRFRDEGRKSNPEELVSAGLAGRVSMAVANQLEQAVTEPEAVHTTVNCPMTLDREMGPTIDRIEVNTEVVMEDVGSERVVRMATRAQKNCPVSRLFGDVDLDSTSNTRISTAVRRRSRPCRASGPRC